MTSSVTDVVLSPTVPSVYFLTVKIYIKHHVACLRSTLHRCVVTKLKKIYTEHKAEYLLTFLEQNLSPKTLPRF